MSRYFLGVDKEGYKTYLNKATFDCDWYWGFGYIETKVSHSHFNYMFLKDCDSVEVFKNHFETQVLSDNEIWTLMELMKSLYIIREYSDTIYSGGAHFTNNPCTDIIKNKDEYDRINKVVIPTLLDEVYKLFANK